MNLETLLKQSSTNCDGEEEDDDGRNREEWRGGGEGAKQVLPMRKPIFSEKYPELDKCGKWQIRKSLTSQSHKKKGASFVLCSVVSNLCRPQIIPEIYAKKIQNHSSISQKRNSGIEHFFRTVAISVIFE